MMTQSEKIVELHNKVEELEAKINALEITYKNALDSFREETGTLIMRHREQIIKLETYVKKEKERKVKAITKLNSE